MVRVRRALSTDLSPVLVGAIVSEKKIRARQALSNDPNPVLVGAIVSEKKIVKKNFFPLFFLNCYSSAPIGPIWTKKIWAQRARGVLSNDQGSVLLGTIVSEKKIFPLNRYNSAPIGSIWTKKIWS
ncbi:LOW QUALITY PROTEIN: hypothetical protein V1477_006400 [Vespula maculifrons]|uniref:Uncharacterized protein n=1 Tax=Vespula maculifrons TaxID=7453 RepID=A0ABD2CKA4_VESMC